MFTHYVDKKIEEGNILIHYLDSQSNEMGVNVLVPLTEINTANQRTVVDYANSRTGRSSGALHKKRNGQFVIANEVKNQKHYYIFDSEEPRGAVPISPEIEGMIS
jgi:hypothetical protein